MVYNGKINYRQIHTKQHQYCIMKKPYQSEQYDFVIGGIKAIFTLRTSSKSIFPALTTGDFEKRINFANFVVQKTF